MAKVVVRFLPNSPDVELVIINFMAHHGIFMLLEKYPQLRPIIKEGRFLLGYTDGTRHGQQIPVFLLRSPWTQFCIWATTDGMAISAGGVLVVTDDTQWSVESHWQAYSLVTPTSVNLSQSNRPQEASKVVSPMTTLAAKIAKRAAQNVPSHKHKMSPVS